MISNGDQRRLSNNILENITLILFDLDGTLRHNRPDSTQALIDYAVRLGVDDSLEKRRRSQRWAHYYWAQSEELADDMQTFGELNESFWENYIIRNLIAFDCEPENARKLTPELSEFMREKHQPEDWVPPDVPETLQNLKKAGYQLGVLSNRREPCHEHLEQLGLLDFFDLALVAGEVNAWKPDPNLFRMALERLGSSPENAVYVGDNYYSDILGAQQAGLQPILLDPDGVFPDADCPVIRAIGDLQELV